MRTTAARCLSAVFVSVVAVALAACSDKTVGPEAPGPVVNGESTPTPTPTPGPGPSSTTGPEAEPVVRVVNVIPEVMSGEQHQDSEPNLAVRPDNPQHIAASAFTENPAGVGNAPIFVSDDGGATWTACPSVQSELMTGDITLRFTRSTGRLYAGILRRPDTLRLSIQSTDDFLDCATAMTERVNRLQVDQPYVQASDAAGSDRVYVGNNDFAPTVAGRTATVDRTLAGPDGWGALRIEARATSGQDLPPIRPAIGPGNVVYAAFIARRGSGSKSEVIVVRDDDGANGNTPFQGLTDASDGVAGVRVAGGLNVPFENFAHQDFGQERLVASDLSIAADPNDAARVCVAWGDRRPGSKLTVHLRCSADSGATWTAGAGNGGDVHTIASAKAPALAFNEDGDLGLLTQRLFGSGANQVWETHFELFDTDFALQHDLVLARTPAGAPEVTFIPYLGDYTHVMAVGATFYGIFSANNTPDRAHFPSGVTYQRRHDFDAHTLADLAGDPVQASIDPFFFTVEP
jgi:hypothetical protein